mmetsp:Transcript_9943/g.13531  ORF Transcript_9943/g.13531 Transcript_9943/m.13531 type:complete len:126 (+) Transcript_9943:274-651(+)|eukprot:CAMPEP_0170450772 /NCGR_PEP_ID=MMETSP0123-20130129/205_1 /TAXON_ID=182087 /ORGANISM="Favella ehrenbergii, Strain Fehren 1" /LENGTH=125 /DNA_ID=CAMNT_0010712181 /DNA_START=413 /DNA_END=790 /DNA_ORIENTATION=-
MLVRNELSALQELDHPHIVHVIELLSDSLSYYCVMELMRHGNLMDHYDRLIQRQESLTELDAANIINQILKALNYMHVMGVVHRDLKMENVMVDFESDYKGREELICKVSDFGFVTVLEAGQTTR